MLLLNTFAAELMQAVRTKTDGSHVTLRRNFPSLVSTIDPVKSSKASGSLVVCTQKFFFGWRVWIFYE